MSKLRFIIILLLCGLLIGIIPQSNSQTTVTISFWYTEGAIESAVYDILIAKFEAANPDVKIDSIQKGYFDTESNYENALIAGTQPDVLRSDVSWITKWAVQGVLEPLDAYTWDRNDFYDQVLRLVQWKNTTYGLPQVVDPLGLLYNKHSLDVAGITVPEGGFTFDEFAEVAYNLTDRSGAVQDWTYGYTSAHMTYHFLPIFYGHGANYFEPNSVKQANIAIDSNETRNAIQYLDNLIGNVYYDPTATYTAVTPTRDLQTYANLNEFFVNGKVQIIQQGPWELRSILDNGAMFNKDVYEQVYSETAPSWVGPDNLGFMEVPKMISNGDTYQGMHIGGHAYVMSKKVNTEDKAIVFKFMDYLSSKEANYIRGKTNHLLSPRKSFYTDDFNTSDSYIPADDPFVKGFKLNLDNAIPRPVHPYFITMDQLFAEELTEHLLENQDTETTISNTLLKWNNYFSVYSEIDDGSVTATPTTPTTTPTTTTPTTTPIPIPPTINSPPDITYEEGLSGFSIQWIASDENPKSYTITRDGEVIFPYISYAWESGVPIEIIVDGLAVGVYHYKIEVNNEDGFSATDEVKVTVVSKSRSTTSKESSSSPQISWPVLGGIIILIPIIVVGKLRKNKIY
ncbi:MAG: extracellular solute-binding protein [Candidatus Kariarchaeaceae archaeon]